MHHVEEIRRLVDAVEEVQLAHVLVEYPQGIERDEKVVDTLGRHGHVGLDRGDQLAIEQRVVVGTHIARRQLGRSVVMRIVRRDVVVVRSELVDRQLAIDQVHDSAQHQYKDTQAIELHRHGVRRRRDVRYLHTAQARRCHARELVVAIRAAPLGHRVDHHVVQRAVARYRLAEERQVHRRIRPLALERERRLDKDLRRNVLLHRSREDRRDHGLDVRRAMVH